MARAICKAKSLGLVPTRGKANIEWYKNGAPQCYCYGPIDLANDELLEVCRECPDHVDRAQDDYDEWRKHD